MSRVGTGTSAGSSSGGGGSVTQGTSPWVDNITQIGGAAITLGQKTMANSFPVVLASDQTNIPTNVAQINGVTVLMGNGGTGTGSQRVTIASDNSAIALWGQGATGAAVPANAVYTAGISGSNLKGYKTDVEGNYPIVGRTVTGSGSDGLSNSYQTWSDVSGNNIEWRMRPFIYNNSTWDRIRSVINATDSTGMGIQAVGNVYQFDDTSPGTVTENQFGNGRMSVRREQYVQIRDAAGNERGLNIDASGNIGIGSIIPGTGATNLGKAEDAVHTTGDVGVMALGVRNDNGAVLAGADGDYLPFTTDATGALRTDLNGTVSTNNSTTATLLSGAVFTGTSDDSLNYNEIRITVIASHASATDGLSIQQSSDNSNWDITDTYTVPAATGKTYSVPRQARYFRIVYTNGGTGQSSFRLQTILNRLGSRVSSQRAGDAYTNETDLEQSQVFLMGYNGATWDRLRSDTTNGLDIDVTRLPALVAGTALVGKVGLDQTTPGTTNAVSIAQIGGTTIVNGGTAGSQSVGGIVANNGTINSAVNPVLVGGQAVSSENAANTTAKLSQFVTDLVGKLIVLPYANPENFVSGAITSAMTGTTTTSLIAAPAAGLRNYITTIIVSNAHATVGTDVIIQDGSGGTTLYTIPAAAVYGGAVVTFPTPLRQPTTATAIFCANVTTGASTKVSASGYKGV